MAIVTDSNVCLPAELVGGYGIHIVPLGLIFEDRAYRDGIDITADEFYTLPRQSKKLPTTSAPSPGDYLEAYRQAAAKAEGILCVTLSSKLSMGFNSALEAREIAQEELPQVSINVVDSLTAGAAQGFIALAAARAAASGQDLARVTETAQSLIPRVNFVLVMDTLYYLAKGGRIPKAAAWAGSILSIKPIIQLSGGGGQIPGEGSHQAEGGEASVGDYAGADGGEAGACQPDACCCP